ncbi:MAG: DUF2490 domain-containing protein, partial [Candidatus Latescibacterota bacterium]
IRNIFKWPVQQKIQLLFTQEYRNQGFSLYNEPFAKFLEVGVQYNPAKAVYTMAGYRRQWNDLNGGTVNENRWIVSGGIKATAYDQWTFDMRLRFDGKYFDDADVEDYIWYRVRFSPSYHAKVKDVEISPYMAVELFGDTRAQSTLFINRNRIHAGTALPLGGHFSLAAEYMREDIHQRGATHVLRLQFTWTI